MKKRRVLIVLLKVLFLIFIGLIIGLIGIILWTFPIPTYHSYDPSLNLIADSSDLEQTVVVSSLESPIPEGKNAIWCASFQLAWNVLGDEVLKEQVKVRQASDDVDCLNRAEVSAKDLQPDSYYARAGSIDSNIINTIREEIGEKFPRVNVEFPQELLNSPSDGIAAYSYINAQVKFKIPFIDNEKPLEFEDSQGLSIPVRSFGLSGKYDGSEFKIRRQIHILYSGIDSYEAYANGPQEYIIDLCRTSIPYQVVMARVPWKESLKQIYLYCQEKIQEADSDEIFTIEIPQGDNMVFDFTKKEFLSPQFEMHDILLVPEMFWKISHRFQALEGLTLVNKGYEEWPIVYAGQEIQFQLDRSGAGLESVSCVVSASKRMHYVFDGPFLLYMKHRQSEYPFFVLWVDNAELLHRFEFDE
ncbi:MAG: hypothetical protein JW860_15725 [Sedimentisphaerales bacterium]|nr:hypothetical protein [Sedimentisphaerales bacterium]